MKKLLSFLVAILATVAVWAQTFQSGDLHYKVTSSTAYTVEVTESSQYSGENYKGITAVVVPESVSYEGQTYSVTAIGEAAFKNAAALTSVSISNSVLTIGESAFVNCNVLSSVTLGNSVTTIETAAFNNCAALKTITIPASVNNVYYGAFVGAGITSIYMEGTPPALKSAATSYLFTTSPVCYVPCSAAVSYSASKWQYEVSKFVAEFPYSFQVGSANESMGVVAVTQQPDCTNPATIEATPNTGYHFVEWSDGNTNNPRNIRVTEDITLAAEFAANTYTLVLTAGENGEVSEGGTFEYGTTVTITATANEGYKFVQWSDGNTDNPRTLTITTDTGLTAEFAADYTIEDCQIRYTSTDGKIVTPNAANAFGEATIVSNEYNDGVGVITFNTLVETIGETAFANCQTLKSIVIPNRVKAIEAQAFVNCKKLVDVTIPDGVESIGKAAFNNCYALKAITLPASVKYIYNAAFVGVGLDYIYSLSPTAPILNPEREDPYMVLGVGAVPVCYVPCGALASYEASDWKTKSQVREIVETPYLFIVKSASGLMGSATITESSLCDEYKATITATPNVGYHFVQWSDGNTNATREVIVNADITYTAEFAVNTYQTTVTVNGNGTVVGAGTYNYGDTVILTVTPDEGYHFVKWSDGNTDNPRTLIVTGDANYTAEFAVNTYELTVTANGNGTVAGAGTYNHGATATISATANSGYRFVQWSDGNTENPRTLIVTGDANYTAEFAEDENVKNCKIYYTSTDGNVVNPYSTTVFGANIVSNTYENGKGIITFDAPVTSIGSYAFYNCSKLVSITLPSSVTSIGSSAFYQCSLPSIIIPNGVTSIGGSAFYNCPNLASITLPSSVTSIGSSAFYNCTALVEVNYLGDIAGWCGITFDTYNGNPAQKAGHLYINGKELKGHLDIPNGVTSIGSTAFSNLTSITSLTIPYSVTSIGSRAFSGIAAHSLHWNAKEAEVGSEWFYSGVPSGAGIKICLESVTIGDSVESIPNNFLSSISFANKQIITVPSSVNKIGDKAFYTSYVACILFDSKIPATIGTSVVYNNTIMGVYNLDTYIEAWPEYEAHLESRDKAYAEVTISAQPDKSALLETIGVNSAGKVCYLKINGTINSYDIMVIRNRMPKLFELDLADVSIVANAYEYSTGRCSKNDTLTQAAFTGTGTIIEKLTLPKSLKYIEPGSINTKVKNLTIHNGKMANSAFKGLYLVSVYLSDSITSIPTDAFTNCTYLKNVRFSQKLETIGDYAFQNVAIDTLVLPASVSSLGTAAFSGQVNTLLNKYYIGTNSWADFSSTPLPATGERYRQYSLRNGRLKKLVIPKDSRLKEISSRAFEGNEDLASIDILCDSITTIKELAFSKCGFDTLILPPNISSIGTLAFSECENLRYIVMPETYTKVNHNAFIKCANLNKIQFPSTLNVIEHHAFADCTNLPTVDIPGMVTNIGEGAFLNCQIKNIYTYLFDPFTIGQNTFSAYANANATLYVPNIDNVEMKYIYDTQWSQILKCVRMDRTFEYKDFYANGDVVIGEQDETMTGTPNASLNPGSGLVVEEGENTQNLGKVTLSGSVENWASLIAGCNTNVDTLQLSLTVQGHKWHFLGFPFPVKIADIQSDYQFAIFEYDGELRAAKDTTGWKSVPKSQEYLEAGQGYIIQFNTPSTCEFSIKVNQPNFCEMVDKMNLKVYPSEKTRNKSWNYVSNPYFAYYDISDLNYTGPITFWDVQTGTYKTFRAGDDDYVLSPYEAFFLQNTDETGQFNLVFDKTKGMTKQQSQQKASSRIAAKQYAAEEEVLRSVVNITLSDGTYTDATRVVINEDASFLYEMGVDAAKFMSTERVPQLFSYDLEQDMCAINERPMGNGTIDLGIKLPKSGSYFFSCTRMDTTFYLLDRENNITHDFAHGDYYFNAKAGTNRSRFALIRSRQNVTTDLENINGATIETSKDGLYVHGEAYLQVYNVAGALIMQGNMSGHVALTAGVYMVVNNGVTTKHVIK